LAVLATAATAEAQTNRTPTSGGRALYDLLVPPGTTAPGTTAAGLATKVVPQMARVRAQAASQGSTSSSSGGGAGLW
jgi:hypothetical protein